MVVTWSQKQHVRLLSIYLLFVGFVSSVFGVIQARLESGWGVGDWLINYSAGFVRRGLVGEIILLLSQLTHQRYVWITAAIQIAVYVVFLCATYKIAKSAQWNLPLYAAFFSPATLAFIVLDPPNGFKKEIMLFASLAVLIVLLLFRKVNDIAMSVLLCLVCSSLILSHEVLFFYLPYVLGAVALKVREPGRLIRITAAPILVSLAAVAIAAHNPGNLSIAQGICGSLGHKLDPISLYVRHDSVCAGAIAWLQLTLPDAHKYVMGAVAAHHNYRTYSFLALLTFAPIVYSILLLARGARRREAQIIAICGLVCLVGSIVIFYSGRDWGRWIHIHAVCLLLLLLMANQPQEGEAPQTTNRLSLAAALLLVLYAACWNMPAVDIYDHRTGYIGLVSYLKHKSASSHTQAGGQTGY